MLTPATIWRAWNTAPSLLISLAATVLVYAWGMHKARSRPRAVACFAGAMLTLAVALVSPLDALGDALFTAHMLQHMVLLLVAAPLLVLSEYPVALLRALPSGWAQSLVRGLPRSGGLRRVWDALNMPAVAWLIFAIELWAWHSSALYEAALRSETLHALEHISFVLSGMLFWWVLFKRTTVRHTQYGMAVAYLFAASVQSGILGALMMFTTVPWYAFYASRVAAWGMTPIQDQQLAGLIMWIPGGALFNVLTIAYFAAWWRAMDERSTRRRSAHAAGDMQAEQQSGESPAKRDALPAEGEPEAR